MGIQMKLEFSATVTAADAGRRIISGKIVPFGTPGMTSAGSVIFERGSIQVPNVSKIKLLAQHEQTASGVIGRAQSIHEAEDGMYATFKISASRDGENFLIKAAEGLLDGLSVGVEVIASKERKDGTMVVTASRLNEVSLVETPAFDSARVSDVAAQAGDMMEDDTAEENLENMEDEQIQKISDAVEALKIIQVTEKALEESETQTESEASVSENTAAATTEAAAPAEASRPTIKASVPYGDSITRTRHGIDTMGKYVAHKIYASQGDLESREWIAAAEDPTVVQAAADSIGTTNPAFNPIQYMKELYTNNRFGAPARDAVSRGVLPTSGMTFQIPSLVTSAGGGSGVAPTVAVTAEAGTPSDTGMATQYLTGTVKKYAGQNTISLELLERSSPVFFDELAKQMELAYLKSIDAAILAGLVSGGTVGTKNYAATSAGIIDFVSTESALAYSASSDFAQNYLAGTSQWSLLMGAVDTTGRPIYNAGAPMNSAGNSNPTSIKGNVLGLDLFVDYQAVSTTIDDSAFIIVPSAVTWYESPTSYFSVNNVGNMQVQTAIYGYGSLLVKNAGGIRRFNVA
jgi:HK97 family phage prohead protease/HK97 family phage major capsid protein